MATEFIDVDASLRNELEGQKEEFEEEIAQTEEETRNLNNELRILEEEAATLHRQRVRIANLAIVQEWTVMRSNQGY